MEFDVQLGQLYSPFQYPVQIRPMIFQRDRFTFQVHLWHGVDVHQRRQIYRVDQRVNVDSPRLQYNNTINNNNDNQSCVSELTQTRNISKNPLKSKKPKTCIHTIK